MGKYLWQKLSGFISFFYFFVPADGALTLSLAARTPLLGLDFFQKMYLCYEGAREMRTSSGMGRLTLFTPINGNKLCCGFRKDQGAGRLQWFYKAPGYCMSKVKAFMLCYF